MLFGLETHWETLKCRQIVKQQEEQHFWFIKGDSTAQCQGGSGHQWVALSFSASKAKQKWLLEAEASQTENGQTRFAFLMFLAVEYLMEQDFPPLDASTFSRCHSENHTLAESELPPWSRWKILLCNTLKNQKRHLTTPSHLKACG